MGKYAIVNDQYDKKRVDEYVRVRDFVAPEFYKELKEIQDSSAREDLINLFDKFLSALDKGISLHFEDLQSKKTNGFFGYYETYNEYRLKQIPDIHCLQHMYDRIFFLIAQLKENKPIADVLKPYKLKKTVMMYVTRQPITDYNDQSLFEKTEAEIRTNYCHHPKLPWVLKSSYAQIHLVAKYLFQGWRLDKNSESALKLFPKDIVKHIVSFVADNKNDSNKIIASRHFSEPESHVTRPWHLQSDDVRISNIRRSLSGSDLWADLSKVEKAICSDEVDENTAKKIVGQYLSSLTSI